MNNETSGKARKNNCKSFDIQMKLHISVFGTQKIVFFLNINLKFLVSWMNFMHVIIL